jgi:Raf kinase inhibitor-like YbhB/YbcL family protein
MSPNFRTVKLSAILFLSSIGAVLAQPASPPANAAPPMVITSSSFPDGGVVPNKYTMASPSPVSPAFTWSNAPVATVSFVFIMHDLDTLPRVAPRPAPGNDNLHWEAFNIPATTTSFPEGMAQTAQLPDGTIQLTNGGGRGTGYLPLGARTVYHHYVVELYALNIKLDLAPMASRADVAAAMEGHVVGKAAYEGRFYY